MKLHAIACVGLLALVSAPLRAQALFNPSVHPDPGHWDLSAGYADMDISYEILSKYRFNTPDFGSKAYFIGGDYGINASMDAFVSAGLIDDLSNSEHPSVSGDGTALAVGLDGALYQHGALEVDLYGQLLRLDTTFSDEVAVKATPPNYVNSRDITQHVLTLGAAAIYTLGPVHVSAGPEWIAYEDGDYEFVTREQESGAFFEQGTLDIDHADTLGARFGISYDVPQFSVFLHASAGHEEGVTLGGELHF